MQRALHNLTMLLIQYTVFRLNTDVVLLTGKNWYWQQSAVCVCTIGATKPNEEVGSTTKQQWLEHFNPDSLVSAT